MEQGRLTWRKSSYSGGNANCVEVAWQKSSYSGGNADCVEVAASASSAAVRDSKRRDGGQLGFSATAWEGLLASTRSCSK